MLLTIAAILVILWILGLVTAYTLGGFIHILLVVAIILVLIRIIQGKESYLICRGAAVPEMLLHFCRYAARHIRSQQFDRKTIEKLFALMTELQTKLDDSLLRQSDGDAFSTSLPRVRVFPSNPR